MYLRYYIPYALVYTTNVCKSPDARIHCSTFQCRNTNLNILQEFWNLFAFSKSDSLRLIFKLKLKNLAEVAQ
jgi:hypothetical protein